MKQSVSEAIQLLGEAKENAPKLFGIPTGVPGLDDLFFVTKIVRGKRKIVPLGGYPSHSVINVTGAPDTGKTLMAEQFALTQANLGYPTVFVTVESPSAFVARSIEQKAKALKIKFEKIRDKIILVDAASFSILREDLPSLLSTLAEGIKAYHANSVVIDSVTGLFEAKEMLARTIVRELFNFMKKWYQTALFISQKRSSHELESAEAAGGYAVGHIVDSTIVLSKKIISSKWEAQLYKANIGDVIRFIRIDGCRMCGHDVKTHLLEIDKAGIIKVGPTLDKLGGQK